MVTGYNLYSFQVREIIKIVFIILYSIFLFLQRVGCDLRIGSSKKVDACGVCGGNGSTCSQPIYQWDIAPMSLCSVTCGGGKLNLNTHTFYGCFITRIEFRDGYLAAKMKCVQRKI